MLAERPVKRRVVPVPHLLAYLLQRNTVSDQFFRFLHPSRGHKTVEGHILVPLKQLRNGGDADTAVVRNDFQRQALPQMFIHIGSNLLHYGFSFLAGTRAFLADLLHLFRKGSLLFVRI